MSAAATAPVLYRWLPLSNYLTVFNCQNLLALVFGEFMKATWNNATIAESDKTIVIEGNHYFPPDTITSEHLQPSDKHSTCPWKGEASYYDVVVNGEVNKDAAWYYPEPKAAAAEIKGYIAFWRGVKVE